MATIEINSPSSHNQTVQYPSGPIVATASVTNTGTADGWVRLNITGVVSQVGVLTRVIPLSQGGRTETLRTSIANPYMFAATFYSSAEVEELNASGARIGILDSHDRFRIRVEKPYVAPRRIPPAPVVPPPLTGIAAAKAEQQALDAIEREKERLQKEQDEQRAYDALQLHLQLQDDSPTYTRYVPPGQLQDDFLQDDSPTYKP